LISHSISNYHLFTYFVVLLLVINQHQIKANSLSNRPDYQLYPSIYDDFSYDDSESPIVIYPSNLYTPDNDEIISQNPWSKLFHRSYERSILTPTYYSPPQSGFALRNGEISYITYPAQKRAIPIELQKALFAHGIVGRRR
jgi:hypothetical protein